MAEPEKQQFGDGRDNYAGAARQLSDALQQAGQTGARQAVSNGAAALVQSGIKSGKAVSEIAAGTAAGGPWGAILSAAWSLRHTLFKILACLCVLLLIFVILIVSIPSVVLNGVFGLNGSIVDMDNPMSMMQSYEEMSAEVSAAVDRGYQVALERVDQLIQDGGYDYELSIESLIDEAKSASGFNAAYVLAAYSASMLQQGTSADDMTAKLDAVAEQMFPISSEEKEKERVIPLTYTTYREVTMAFPNGTLILMVSLYHCSVDSSIAGKRLGPDALFNFIFDQFQSNLGLNGVEAAVPVRRDVLFYELRDLFGQRDNFINMVHLSAPFKISIAI